LEIEIQNLKKKLDTEVEAKEKAIADLKKDANIEQAKFSQQIQALQTQLTQAEQAKDQALTKLTQDHQKEDRFLLKEVNKELTLPFYNKPKTLREAINEFIKQKCRNERHVPTFSDKCMTTIGAPFR
jgi:hypothetical protein